MDTSLRVDSGNRSGLLRALSVIELLAERAPETLGVSAIARDLGLPKAVAHRILKELTGAAFLDFDDTTKQYRLGAGALTLGLAALRSLDVPVVARPHLERLVAETGETATLSMRQGWSRVYIPPGGIPHEVHMRVKLGSRHPLHAGASSKAILAGLTQEEIDRYLDSHELNSLTPATITVTSQLRDELRRIRRRGFAISVGERQPGAGSVAAVVRDANGEVWGSISLCGPRDRFDAGVCEAHGERLVAAAESISKQLGYRGASTFDLAVESH